MTDTDISAAIVERAMAGTQLTETELTDLDSANVLALGMLADEVRRARVGDTVTYVRVLEVGAGERPAGEAVGSCGEVRAVTLPGTLAETIDVIRGLRASIGGAVRLTGFSLADVLSRGWGAPDAVLAAFKQAGLDAIAEAPLDLVTPEHVGVVRHTGLGLGTLSVQRPADTGRVALVMRARDCLGRNPHVTSVDPLPREQSVAAPTTGYHDVRMVALARIALPSARTIQVDWQQYGPKLAQVALSFGANHLDRVSSTDDPTLGRRRSSVEEVRRHIASAGFTPVEQGPGR